MKKLLASLPLRAMLTLPYVVLLLLTALLISAVFYTTGRDTVNSLSEQLITEMVGRISQAVEKHVSGSEAVLETAFPGGMPGPQRVEASLGELRTRFWQATSVHRQLNNYAYYGDRDGHFFGLWRHSATEGELRLRTQGTGPRAIHRFTGLDGALGAPTYEQRIFDPRERPWYRAGQQSTSQTWTSIYIDFKTQELISTRARRVLDASGAFQGVVATDLSLQRLNDFVRSLALPPNGVAIILEQDGKLIATSRGPHLKPADQNASARLNAADSSDPLVAGAWRTLLARGAEAQGEQARTDGFAGPDGNPVLLGSTRVRDAAGLDWTIAVAVPRSDFLGAVMVSTRQSAVLAITMGVLIALVGYGVLSVLSRDLRRLAQAARAIGEGRVDTPLAVDRRDEIGDLAKAFRAMQAQLHTDVLTGLANREAILRRIEDHIVQHRRRGDARPFAVMFVDLNNFKRINDTYGHDAGDEVLRLLAERMRRSLRAEDMAARYAGDEFVVLLAGVSRRADAEAARAHLEQALAAPWAKDLPGVAGAAAGDVASVGGGAAIGLAFYPDDGLDVQTLLKRADVDMYDRKRIGRDAAT